MSQSTPAPSQQQASTSGSIHSSSPSSSAGSTTTPVGSAAGVPSPPSATKKSASKISQSKVPSKSNVSTPPKSSASVKPSKEVIATSPVVDADDEPAEVITHSQAKANQSQESCLRIIFLILITLLLITDLITFGLEYAERKRFGIEMGLSVSILITMILFGIAFFIIGFLGALYHNYWLLCRYGIGMCIYGLFGIIWLAAYPFKRDTFNIARLIDVLLIIIIIPITFLLVRIAKKVYPNPWYPSACCGPYFVD